MNFSILIPIAISLLLLVVVSWILPSLPAFLAKVFRRLRAGLGIYAVFMAVGIAAILIFLLQGAIASVSFVGMLSFLPLLGLAYLAVHFRTQIVAWLASKGINTNTLILIVVSLAVIIAVTFEAIVGQEVVTALCFLVVIALTLLLFLPHAFLLRLLRAAGMPTGTTTGTSAELLPMGLRMVIAWLSFVAFFGLMYPGVMTMTLGLISIFVSIILFMTAAHAKSMRGTLAAMVLVMCAAEVWQWASPDSYRSVVELGEAQLAKLVASGDRQKITDKAQAMVTYARPNRNINVLYSGYEAVGQLRLNKEEDAPKLNKSNLVRIVDQKKGPSLYDGQGFLEIKVPDEDGSYVNGTSYWVEADYLDIVSPAEIQEELRDSAKVAQQLPFEPAPKKDSLDILLRKAVSAKGTTIPDSVFTAGKYYIPVDSITPFRIHVVSDKTCNKYSTKSTQTYSLVYDDGAVIHDHPGVSTIIPNRPEPKFQLMGKGVVELAVN